MASSASRRFNVAVVGATGMVGHELLKVLSERHFPAAGIRALASERSAGTALPYNGSSVVVETLSEESFRDIDIAFFAVGSSQSLHYAPFAVDDGALVIDKSGAWRMEDNVPLVVPEINADQIASSEGIISVPNCCTIPLTMVLEPLRKVAPIERVVISTYQSASGAGKDLVQELEDQVQAIAGGRPPEHRVYPHQLVHNVVPGGWAMEGDEGYNEEEVKLVNETRKILAAPELPIAVTCVRVPVPVGHSEAVFIQFAEPLSPDAAREVLAAFPGIEVIDDAAGQGYPTAAQASGRDEVFVGRIRSDPSVANGLALWVVTDNLRKGAALNGVQIAERAIQMGVVR